MNQTPKTIQIFLPGGDPQGIRVAEITTRILQVIEVPRKLLSDFFQMPESNQVGIYFLFGESEGEEPNVYIGQTGDLSTRLKKHNNTKDFWERALVVISRTNSMTQTHAVFLEWHCLQACRAAERYADENGNSGSQPHTPAPLKADCLEIFDTAKTLLATLGYPVFDPVVKSITDDDIENEDDKIYYCKASGADGRGQYTSEGFVVLKGSIGRKQNVPSVIGTSIERTREKLLKSGVFRIEDDKVICQKNHLFGSPSMAAMSLMGRTVNGWKAWRDKNGRTLDELKRQSDDT
jgi:predicted GIY-YIG superfamily endonuclease